MVSFKQSDLDELRNSSRYVSDVFIEFYFTYLSWIHQSNSILFVPPTISFLIANSADEKDVAECVKPLELHTKDLIFFPVNNGGIHWSLVIYHREFNVFAHHDSLGGLNNDEAVDLYLAVRYSVHERQSLRYRIEFGNKRRLMDEPCVPDYKRLKTPQQKNGFDCGLYVMAMAKAICRWFCSRVREETWMGEIEKLDDAVGYTMRPLVLQLIREASQGRLGSVSCTIEEERRDGKVEELTNDEIELYQFWTEFDDPVDSETTTGPSTSCRDDLPPSIAGGKIVANDSPSVMEEETNKRKVPLPKEEAVNDNDTEMVHRFSCCDSTSASSSTVVDNKPVEGISTIGENDAENILDTSALSDCRTSLFNREYLTSWPPEESSSVD